MSHTRLWGLALAAATLGLASGCPSGTAPPVAGPEPTAAASVTPEPTATPMPSPSPTPTPEPTPELSPIPSPTPTPVPSATAAAFVTLKDGAFTPANVIITATGTVTWKNESGELHTITPEELGTFRGTGEIEPLDHSRAVMFTGIGAKKYYCLHHPNEKGTVTVQDDRLITPPATTTP